MEIGCLVKKMEECSMKCFYIDADRCIREASKGHVVHLKDNLYLISTETASQQKLIPENICSTAPFWIIGYAEPEPIQNAEKINFLFFWNNFFAKFSDNAHEYNDFNLRDE